METVVFFQNVAPMTPWSTSVKSTIAGLLRVVNIHNVKGSLTVIAAPVIIL